MRGYARKHLLSAALLALLGLLLTACGAGGPPDVGDRAPAFDLPAAQGGSVSLADYRGEPVLLFFHMAEG